MRGECLGAISILSPLPVALAGQPVPCPKRWAILAREISSAPRSLGNRAGEAVAGGLGEVVQSLTRFPGTSAQGIGLF
jgi:hypothetical protein